MIEKIILNYLLNNNINAYMEVPTRPDDDMVIIEKTSSDFDNHIKRATFAIQSYGRTLLDAAELNETVKGIMLDIVALNEIGSCKLNSDYNYTDTTTKKYRYQAVFDVVYY